MEGTEFGRAQKLDAQLRNQLILLTSLFLTAQLSISLIAVCVCSVYLCVCVCVPFLPSLYGFIGLSIFHLAFYVSVTMYLYSEESLLAI